MTKNNSEIGAEAESKTWDLYLSKGYVGVERNWHGSGGEIDLIVSNESLLVFCEVKYRSSDSYGVPQSAVTVEKQKRIRQTALEWLSQNQNHRFSDLRFDVAAVTPSGVMIYEGCF